MLIDDRTHTQDAPYAVSLVIHFYPEPVGCLSTTGDLACPEYLNAVGWVHDGNGGVGVRDGSDLAWYVIARRTFTLFLRIYPYFFNSGNNMCFCPPPRQCETH